MSIGRRALGRALRCLTVLCCCCILLTCYGQQPPTQPGLLRFRYVYIPDDAQSELTRGYMALSRERFDRMLSTIRAGAQDAANTASCQIRTARYTARLEGDQLVDGRAELDVVQRSQETTTLSLEPCGLALEAASWESDEEQAALIGRDSSGQLVALVNQSSPLHLSWTLRGRPGSPGETTFDLRLPACPSSELIVDLPRGVTPIVVPGVASPIAPTPAAPAADQQAGRQAWRIELGGISRASLTCISEQAMLRRRQRVLLQQEVKYNFSPSGVELQLDLHLEVHHQALRHLTLEMSSPLQLLTARLGESELAFHARPETTGEVVLDFPQPILGSGHVVRLSAFSPIVLGQRWKLPAVHVQGVFWEEGTATLLIAKPLDLRQLETGDCRQSKVGRLPDGGESIQLQCYSPDASVELVLDYRQPQLRVVSGTTISWSLETISARIVADIQSVWGEQFVLNMHVPRPWFVDSIETQPATLLDESALSLKLPSQRLRIPLRTPVRPGQDVRLVIRAHRRAPAEGAPLPGRQLRVATFPDIQDSRYLVSVDAALTGDAALVRLDPAELSSADSELIDGSAGRTIFLDTPSLDQLRVSPNREEPIYTTHISVDASIAAHRLTESYRIRCSPESLPLSQVRVRLSCPRATPVEWSLAGESDEQSLSARLVAEPDEPRFGVRGGETWEISLQPPLDRPFEILGSRHSSLSGKQPLSLASLSQAASQTGMLTIHATDGDDILIENTQLTALPGDPLPSDQYPTVRAKYRYEPSKAATVWVSQSDSTQRQPNAWVWSCRIHSRFAVDGDAQHEIVYRIENQGRRVVRLQIPASATLQSVQVDEMELAMASWQTDPISIPLPRDRRFPTLRLLLRSHSRRLDKFLASEATARLPTADLPVLSSQWLVSLPAGYAAELREGIQSQAAPDWRERLLGTWHRRRAAAPWLALDRWPSTAAATPAGKSRRDAERFLAALGTLVDQAGSTGLLSWGDLLTQYLREAEKQDRQQPLPQLQVDDAALSAIGVTARTSVPNTVASAPQDKGAQALAASNLAICAHQDALVLTSSAQLSRLQQGLTRTSHYHVGVVDSDWLAQDIRSKLASSSEYVSLDAWTDLSHRTTSPWSESPSKPYEGIANAGWTTYVVDLDVADDRDSLSIGVYRPPTIRALGWAAFLMTAGLLVWLSRTRRRRLLPPLAAAAALALWYPHVQFLPILHGLVAGCLVAWALVLAWPRPSGLHARDTSSNDSAPSTAPISTWLFVLALLLPAAICVAAHAQQAKPATSSADKPAVYRVLIPVDAEQKPTSQYNYLPQAFYDEIHRRAAAAQPTPQGWLIYHASYQGTLNWLQPAGQLGVDRLRATYDIELFQSGRQVLIPLGGDQVNVFEAEVNGQPVSPTWNEDRSGLLFQLEQPRTYRLQLVLQPKRSSQDEFAGFDFAVPPVASSLLRLALPKGAPAVQVRSALGAIGHEPENNELVAQLGPAPRLTVYWPANSKLEPAKVSVDELIWLNVRPGSVVADARFTFSVQEGGLRQIRLHADPRLRLLPLSDDQPVVGEPKTRKDESANIIELDLQETVRDEVTILASFHWTGRSGIGNIHPPLLFAEAEQTRRRWFAVTAADSLQLVQHDSQPAPADTGEAAAARLAPAELAPEDFARAWPSSDQLPQRAFTMPPLRVDELHLATRFKLPQSTVQQRTDVGVGREMLRVRYEALVQTSQGYDYRYELEAPAAFRIELAAIAEQGMERPVRFARGEAETVTVFLDRPSSTQQRLVLRGTVPTTRDGPTALPLIWLRGADLQSGRIHVYRLAEVRDVGITQLKGLSLSQADPSDVEDALPDFGRLLASLESNVPVDRTQVAGNLEIVANEPRLRGLLATTMRRQQQAWVADAHLHLQVLRGVVDVVRLEIPAEWSGPFELQPQLPYEVVPLPGQSRRQLVIRPQREITEDFDLHLHGPLTTVDGDRMRRAPDIQLLDVDLIERYLVLPAQLDQQQISWETSGLQAPAKLPEPFREKINTAAMETYYVEETRFQATIKNFESVSGLPQVRLADIHLAWRGRQTCYGLASFDLEPAGIPSCELVLPAPYRLVHATVAGVPANLRSLKPRHWLIQLGALQLPQRIVVVYQGDIAWDSPGRQLTFHAPLLLNVPVARTLWTIHGPHRKQLATAQPAEARIDALRQEMFRLEATSALIDLASAVVAERSAQEVENWYQPWAARLAVSQRRIMQLRFQPGLASRLDLQRVESIQKEQSAVAQRLRTLELKDRISDRARLATPADTCAASGEGSATTYWMFAGSRPSLTVRYLDSAREDLLWRLAVSSLLCAGLLLAYLLGQKVAVREWFLQWPHAVGVAIGLLWWLWFWPGLLGLLVVLVCLAGSLRSTCSSERKRAAR